MTPSFGGVGCGTSIETESFNLGGVVVDEDGRVIGMWVGKDGRAAAAAFLDS